MIWADAFYYEKDSKVFWIEGDSLKNIRGYYGKDRGMGFRLFAEGKCGFCSTISIRYRDLKKCANTALGKFLSFIAYSFTAKSILEKFSPFTYYINKLVLNPSISIIDNALVKRGIASRTFDDQRYPTGKTVIVEKGIFKDVYIIHGVYIFCKNSLIVKRGEIIGRDNRNIIIRFNLFDTLMEIMYCKDFGPTSNGFYSYSILLPRVSLLVI